MKKKKFVIGTSIILLIIFGLIFNKKPKLETKPEENTDVVVNSDIKVQIIGEVHKPGVYEISSDARLIDLINLSGGLTVDASDDINMVQKLSDGIIIRILKKNRDTDSNTNKISINNGSLSELMTLKGVGEATASRIIEYRELNGPFLTINDLKKVSGISEKIFNDNLEIIQL
ncbi:MAG: ComEA family DNA-binding protein [Bacilli bacterium]